VSPRSEPDPVLSATVRRLREAKGLTNGSPSERASRSARSRRSNLPTRHPSWTNFRRIARALDLSITRLAAAIEAAERTPDHAG
jgi:hypothetical protein